MLGLDLGIIIGLVSVLLASLASYKLSFFEEWGIMIMSFVGVALIFVTIPFLNGLLMFIFSLTAVLTLAAALDNFPLIKMKEEK
jgi:uncharacterized membrane protein